ncbi:hypothetical protein A4R43_09280 [Amycolatopsis albispora]|uniref:7-cyano-7-deazaguanine synthase (Queuosine biosynthesis) n=2 Tax=Amycolatopsis albispora TaxID=1804986 RepID=A0A344L3S5_9PSEU|nr:hypothetical protein A4R43_09280 [Amycolatopsis albispora]
MAGPAEPWARDLLQVARAVYLVDKRYVRRTEDGWSRAVDLSVEVAEPERWGAAQLEDLATLLATLTSDTWQVRVVGGAAYRQWFDYEERVSEVALFSGGLDSTSYAAQASAQGNDAGTLLLMGYDDNMRARQQEVWRSVDRVRNRPVKLVQIGQRVLSGPGGELEPSTRTRGLLYTATAVAAASAHGVGQVNAPENGQLAINPPLTPNRLAGLSTRSVHPWTLELTNRVIRGLGGAVEVVNPLLSFTKGEVCGQALEAGLSPEDLARTVSCGDPSSARYSQAPPNCGHCFPCLVRRSGLAWAAGIDRTDYRIELGGIDMRARAAEHLRALARWLASDFGFRDLVADMPFPSSTPIPAVLPMLHRGRRELAAMVDQVIPQNSLLRRTWAPKLVGRAPSTA